MSLLKESYLVFVIYTILALFGAGKLKFAIKSLEILAQTFIVLPGLYGPYEKLIFVIVFSTNERA